MQEKMIDIEWNNLKESYTFGAVARQAEGAVLYRQGKAVLLATVTAERRQTEEDFLPLTVQYLERAYAAAKIPGGFIKRESKPGDFETLTSRIIDRSLRPLFPEEYAYPTVITVMVLSADSDVDLQVAALHAANAALLVSGLPVTRSVAALRVGRRNHELLFAPDLGELERSELDLLLVGSGSELLMIEMAVRATEEMPTVPEPEMLMGPAPATLPRRQINEVEESELTEIIRQATAFIAERCRRFEEAFVPLKAPTIPVSGRDEISETVALLRETFLSRIDEAIAGLCKSERSGLLETVADEAEALFSAKGLDVERRRINRALEELQRERVRRRILEEGIRADGRRCDQVRPIRIETNLLPGVHGSCLFTRGETQALVTATLGEAKEGQMYELLTDRSPRTERFMVHYNFPPFCVGEARPVGAPGRRELGHGHLAKRALEPVLERPTGQTVRLVSEILESNGSSSMATVCGGALALASAEVTLSELVAGVAMGLVKEGDRYAILTDIMGLEDHDGDMDFKVAGTRRGMTALQMDIKLGGVDLSILEEALLQAKRARLEILELMEEARERIRPSGALPVAEHFRIDPSRIAQVIGRAGATIREIIEKFEVKIDLDREKGGVKVTGAERHKVRAAREHIEKIATKEEQPAPEYEAGRIYRGTVKRAVDFGLFVEMPGGHDALLHISKMAGRRISDFAPGEEIDVLVLDQKGRKVELALPEYKA